jgi:hypothetical protein
MYGACITLGSVYQYSTCINNAPTGQAILYTLVIKDVEQALENKLKKNYSWTVRILTGMLQIFGPR